MRLYTYFQYPSLILYVISLPLQEVWLSHILSSSSDHLRVLGVSNGPTGLNLKESWPQSKSHKNLKFTPATLFLQKSACFQNQLPLLSLQGIYLEANFFFFALNLRTFYYVGGNWQTIGPTGNDFSFRHKRTTFCIKQNFKTTVGNTIKRVQRQATEWEHMLRIHLSYKILISRIFKVFLQINNKKTDSPVGK